MDKSTDGLKLFRDLIERRITFAEFMEKFGELPKVEQDRLLADNPKSPTPKQEVTAKTEN